MPDVHGPYTYSWASYEHIGLDGGARIEVQAPATVCDIKVEIAGWTHEAGVDALLLAMTPDPADMEWMFSSTDGPYVRHGGLDNFGYRQALDAGGVAVSGAGNMTGGEVVYILAKNLTSWTAPTEQVFPTILIEASCDGPGLAVTYARDVMLLNDRNMEDGTVVTVDEVMVARGAGQQRDLAGATDMFAIAETGDNNMEGSLSIEAPHGRFTWPIGPDLFYQAGPSGTYRAEVDRTAVPLFGCVNPAASCSPSTYWWGFIAGFEETDDPDAFFGLTGNP